MADLFGLTDDDSDLFGMISEVLTEHGPMSGQRLAEVLAGRGADLGDDPEFALGEALERNRDLVMALADGRWVSLPALLAGRVFTRRLTRLEVDHDFLACSPDLSPIVWATDDAAWRRLTDGSPVWSLMLPFDAAALTERGVSPEAVDGDAALALPRGWFSKAGFQAGEFVGVRLAAEGLAVERLAEEPSASDAVARLGQRVAAALESAAEQPLELDRAVWAACADDTTLFSAPLPPLGAALEDCGISRDGEWVAERGFDFRRWHAEQEREVIAFWRGLNDGADGNGTV